MKKILVGSLAVVGVFAVGGACASMMTGDADAPKTPSVSGPAVPGEEEATTPVNEFPNGDYVVGKDIPPGTYETSGAKSGLFEYCDVQTDGKGPGGDGFGQWKNASAAGERIIITLTEADGTLSINGCEPLEPR